MWNQSSASSIQWLYLLIPLGAILPTLFLVSPILLSGDSALLQTNSTGEFVLNGKMKIRFNFIQGFTRLPRGIANESMLSVNQSSTSALTTELFTSHAPCFNSSSCSHSNNSNVTEVTATKSTTQTTTMPITSITTVNDTRTEPRVDAKYHSNRSLHLLYSTVALLFFILAIFYSKLAIRDKQINPFSTKNLNPLPLLTIKPHRIVTQPNTQASLFSNRSSLTLVFLLLFVFFFLLSGIESSCNYLGMISKFSRRHCLLLQFCYLSGRLLDLSINYAWFCSNKPTGLISIKFLILLRLILLSLLSLLHLFSHFDHFLFFGIGFLLASLSNSILSWIERHFYSTQILLRMILFMIISSESIFPLILFHQMEIFIPIVFSIVLCILLGIFLIILYLNQKREEDRSYGLLSTSMGTQSPDQSDNEASNFQ